MTLRKRNSRHSWKEVEKESEERQREKADEDTAKKYDQGKSVAHGPD